MKNKLNNFAYIDGANLYEGVLCSVVSPSNNCSFLLRKLNVPLVYLDTQKNRLKYEP